MIIKGQRRQDQSALIPGSFLVSSAGKAAAVEVGAKDGHGLLFGQSVSQSVGSAVSQEARGMSETKQRRQHNVKLDGGGGGSRQLAAAHRKPAPPLVCLVSVSSRSPSGLREFGPALWRSVKRAEVERADWPTFATSSAPTPTPTPT